MEAQTWRDEAACAGMPLSLFFPGKGQWTTTQKAKAVCSTCPVLDDCRDYAVEGGLSEGVFGGLSNRDYARERTRRGLGPIAPPEVRAGFGRDLMGVVR